MARKPQIPPSRVLRHLSQGAFAAFILISAARHHLVTDQHLASLDAYCPFGGVATFWRWLSTGAFVQKTHSSNLVLALGLLIGTVVAGGAFCGWVCPFGALQELLAAVRRWLRLPELRIPDQVDRWLRYGRYVVLAGILYATISTVKLWFAGFDPYRTVFSLDWLFEPNLAESWPAYLVAGLVLVGALVIPRLWCRYLCPLGGLVSLVQRVSLLRIRRQKDVCIDCGLCTHVCPARLPVAQTVDTTAACIGCLECVEACPVPGALYVSTVLPAPRPTPVASEE
jgi:polyferredoxin